MYLSIRNITMTLAISLLMMSCEKDDPTPSTPNPTPTDNSAQTYPTPSDADAVLVAVKATTSTDTPIGPIDVLVGTAVGIFSNDGFASGDFIQAGTVTCNTLELAINPNNSYTFTDISATNPMGINYSSAVNWSVVGANGISPITHNAITQGFPTTGEITSPATVVRADGYTVTCASVSGADSVLFNIGGVTKTLAGNATACAFSASELSGATTGSSVVQVNAFTIDSEVFGSDTKAYFINQDTRSITVTVE